MRMLRRLFLAFALMAGLSPSFGQAPPAVPGLPDTDRVTTYSISTSTCACSVNFALYGDTNDYWNWLTVWINGVQVSHNDPSYGWVITSPTGPLGNIPRPVTDAVLTFNGFQTGTVQIVGARRPRRLLQFTEGRGVPARDLNQVLTDIIAQNREAWDLWERSVVFEPGFYPNALPLAAARANQFFCFDPTGQPTVCSIVSSSNTFQAGNGIEFSGTNPTVITNNIQAGSGITLTGSNPIVVSANVPSANFSLLPTTRLTLTQGTPVTTSDVTAATSVFLEPYGGNQITLYDGSANWVAIPVAASTYSLPATQTQTGTEASSNIITALTDTSQMVVGEQVTGTNIPGSTTISSIDSLTQIHISNAATGSGAQSLTFKLPPSTAYDIYAVNNSGVPKLLWSAAWSGSTPPARVLQNGVYVLSGTTTQRLLGSVYTSTVAGQLMDSALCRCLSNLYNVAPRSLKLQETTSTWTYSTAAWAQVNNGTPDQVSIMFTVPAFVEMHLQAMWSNSVSASANAWAGIGVDSATVPSSTVTGGSSSSNTGENIVTADYVGAPGIGFHYLSWLEYGVGSNTQTWYGTGGASDRIQQGMMGIVAN